MRRALVCCFFAALLLAPIRIAAGQDRPNIVWISAEDLSPRLGAYGDEVARTPNLDRLAAEGVVYTRAFTSAGAHWCSPLRDEGQPFFSVFNFTTTHESRSWIDPEEGTTTDPASVDVPPYYPDTPEVRRQIANHYDNIATMDEQAGEVLDQLTR